MALPAGGSGPEAPYSVTLSRLRWQYPFLPWSFLSRPQRWSEYYTWLRFIPEKGGLTRNVTVKLVIRLFKSSLNRCQPSPGGDKTG